MGVLMLVLIAALLSRAGAGRFCPRAVWGVMLGALAPELDRTARLFSPELHLKVAHAALHSVFTAPLLVVACAGAIRGISRQRCGWGGALSLAGASVLVNLIVAWAGGQGIRLLWPVSDGWFRGGFLPEWDLWMIVLFAVAWFIPWLLGVASSEMGAAKPSGRGAAFAALCLAVLFGFGRFLLHSRAVAMLESHLYEGAPPLRTAAFPSPLNPLRWTGLVETRESLRRYSGLRPLEEFDPSRGEVYSKAEARPVFEQARGTREFQAFLGFYEWPYWRAAPLPEPEGGWEVEAVDLAQLRGQAARVRAWFDADGRLLRVELRP